jgi:NAD+ kinase
VKKVGILYHPKVEATRVKAAALEAFLKSRGISVWVGSAWDRDEARAGLDGTDLVITVGGDGTILRAVQAVVPGPAPILGVNLGQLGFMTELGSDEALEKLPEVMGGAGWIDERAMLRAELTTKGKAPQFFDALNDVVVARGGVVRLIRVEAGVDGQPLTTFETDGVIVATATGSTGYALAAGGPIIYPQSGDLLLAPVAPHLSLSHALVVPGTAAIGLRLSTYHPASLSIDGHINLPLADGDSLTVRRGPHAARFLRIRPRESFYGSLEAKLKGKRRAPGRKSQNP